MKKAVAAFLAVGEAAMTIMGASNANVKAWGGQGNRLADAGSPP